MLLLRHLRSHTKSNHRTRPNRIVYFPDFGDIGGCTALAGQCVTLDGVINWNATKFSSICPVEKQGSYNGTLSDGRIVVDQIQAALSLSGPYTNCESSTAVHTHQGVVLEIFGTATSQNRSSPSTNDANPFTEPDRENISSLATIS